MAVSVHLGSEVRRRGSRLAEWIDRRSGAIMVLPAILFVLAFAIFPLIVSAYLSLARFALAPGGYKITFVGLTNFNKLLLGAQQYHFLGTFGVFGPLAGSIAIVAGLGLAGWLVRYATSRHFSLVGLLGRLISASLAGGMTLLFVATVVAGGVPGTLMTTMIYVVAGVVTQFLLGLGLALVCARRSAAGTSSASSSSFR